MRPLLLCLFVVLLLGPVRGAEPFFKKGDVIALVGGEDMVVASEYGYLELLLTRALPDYHLRFRNLAWEGDTVFEQRRDLNFPSYEEQLDKIGATVVIAQFGQMESLMGPRAPGFPGSLTAEDAKSAEGRRGKAEAKENPSADLSISSAPSAVKSAPNGLPEFIAAYEKLIERFSGGGKRRVFIIPPTSIEPYMMPSASDFSESLVAFAEAIAKVAERIPHTRFLDVGHGVTGWTDINKTRDGVHLTRSGHNFLAGTIATEVAGKPSQILFAEGFVSKNPSPFEQPTLAAVRAKNRLWFDYWRPQNWAFLAGDRTAQPSSRDHLDPSKRWFPPEREAFLPLLEAKEKEIDALAQKLAAGNTGK